MARRSEGTIETTDNTSGHKNVDIGNVAHQEKPSRKRARTSFQKSGSLKAKAQDVDNSPHSARKIEPIKKPNSKERMPEEFRRVKGKRGLLEWLAKEVPFDVILEIFCCVEPGDLLCLSRTSKDLRTILMSRRYEYIWRSARENVDGLPPRPDDLNEPQYAHLLFDAYCYICKRKGCENILWTFRARVCLKCSTFLQDNVEYLSRQPAAYRDLGILPSEYVQIGGQRILVGSNKYAQKFETEFRLLRTELEREEWIKQKEKDLEAIQEHAVLCIQWRKSTLSNRSKELDALRTERKENIIARLSIHGWAMRHYLWTRSIRTTSLPIGWSTKQKRSQITIGAYERRAGGSLIKTPETS
ncbi:hypothetical protein BDP27DRAFT_441731 [Rhodocollybia butyracea]|uniref:F-box domain-containing protein n=1 Tax=Rhodocollybia butyracea TaxID=206335 RepID=A0A9P5UAK5_9AGAR|nr:hypothetical protein BDP27DRAFT_441731 [Rhodocollybia butyracea]